MIYDYTKYKRVFAFGCSFTGYKYPTWANIMGKHISQAEFYNFGRSGGGNVFIATQGDLKFADKDYLMTYADPLTFLVRDLSIIDLTTSYLNTLPSDTLAMLSVPFNYQQDLNNSTVTQVLNLYKELEDSYLDNMFELEMDNYWEHGSKYIESWSEPDFYEDYHPAPLRYANYLKKIGIELSDEAMQYAIDSTNALRQIKHYLEFEQIFPNLDPRTIPQELL
jgi:hypothetical protein